MHQLPYKETFPCKPYLNHRNFSISNVIKTSYDTLISSTNLLPFEQKRKGTDSATAEKVQANTVKPRSPQSHTVSLAFYNLFCMDNFEAYISTVLEVATRALFCHIIDSGTEAALAMKVIAFWMWLESQGFSDIIKVISSVDDHEFLAQVTEEAESVVFSLQGHSAPSLRATQNLAPDFDSLNALISEKDKVSMGISNFYKRVCYVMFKDILEERNIKLEDQQGEDIVQASCSKVGGTETAESSAPSVPFKLNPFAKEWNPLKDRANESDRCLFLTFSNGYPLNESQIVNFFTQKFGACIERVYVHWENRTDEKMPPLFGKVVFDASYVPASILKGEKEAKFMVEGKPLWCKEFVQKKQKRERN